MSTPVAGSLSVTPLYASAADVLVLWDDVNATWRSLPSVSAPMSVGQGGTGQTALTANAVLVGNGTGPITASAITSDNGATLRVSTNQVIGNAVTSPPAHALVINNAASTPQANTDNPQLWFASEGITECAGDSYGSFATYWIGRRARGTAAAPTALQSGDVITQFGASGRGATNYGVGGFFQFRAMENWSDTGHGTAIAFNTVTNTTTAPAEAMRIDHNGNVGIGTATPQARLHVAGGSSVPSGQVGTFAVTGATGNQRLLMGVDATGTMYGWIQPVDVGLAYRNLSLCTGGGNVGIGTTAPGTNQLSVVNATPGWFAAKFTSPNTTPSAGVLINAGTGVAGDYALLIQNAPATVNLMWVLGNGSCANTSGAWTTVSDAQVKQDIAPYRRGLEAILKLSPVEFRYAPNTPMSEGNKPSRLLFGLIADDVKPHVPEIVGTTTATIGKKEGVELSTLEPGNLIYALINAVKELKSDLDALKGDGAPAARRAR